MTQAPFITALLLAVSALASPEGDAPPARRAFSISFVAAETTTLAPYYQATQAATAQPLTPSPLFQPHAPAVLEPKGPPPFMPDAAGMQGVWAPQATTTAPLATTTTQGGLFQAVGPLLSGMQKAVGQAEKVGEAAVGQAEKVVAPVSKQAQKAGETAVGQAQQAGAAAVGQAQRFVAPAAQQAQKAGETAVGQAEKLVAPATEQIQQSAQQVGKSLVAQQPALTEQIQKSAQQVGKNFVVPATEQIQQSAEQVFNLQEKKPTTTEAPAKTKEALGAQTAKAKVTLERAKQQQQDIEAQLAAVKEQLKEGSIVVTPTKTEQDLPNKKKASSESEKSSLRKGTPKSDEFKRLFTASEVTDTKSVHGRSLILGCAAVGFAALVALLVRSVTARRAPSSTETGCESDGSGIE